MAECLEETPVIAALETRSKKVRPTSRKLCDFRDVAVTIASGSESGDVRAEIVAGKIPIVVT